MVYYTITIALSLMAVSFWSWWGFPVGLVLIGLALWYTYESVVVIEADTLAGRLTFGSYAGDLKPGLHFLWLWLDDFVHVSTVTHEQDIPASPEDIDHVDRSKPKADGSPGDGVPPPGKVPALRVTFIEKVPEEKDGKKMPIKVTIPGKKEPVEIPPDDSFLKRQTAEYEASFGFVVVNLKTFYTTIGSVEAAKQSMMDFVISVLSGELQKHCLAEAMLLKSTIEDDVRRGLEEFCEKAWGIKVTFFRMKPFTFSHDFNKELSLAAAANETAKALVRTSEGEMQKLINEGTGKAKAEQLLLDARTEAYRKMAQIAGTPEGRAAMQLDVAREIAKEGTTLIVPDGNLFGGLVGVANAVQKSFQATTTPTQKTSSNSPSHKPSEEKKETKTGGSPAPTTPNPPTAQSRKRTWKDRNK